MSKFNLSSTYRNFEKLWPDESLNLTSNGIIETHLTHILWVCRPTVLSWIFVVELSHG